MRLFLYYTVHSFVNQIKKLFKTWVIVFFLVCFVMGGAIGLGAAVIADKAEENQQTDMIAEESISEEDIILEEEIDIGGGGLLAALGVDKFRMIELVGGLVILLIFFLEAIGADKNGSNIFLPADVTLLFSAPLKPQSVLMFRLVSTLGTALLASVYLVFQVPNLVLNLHLSGLAAFGILFSWILTLVMAEIIRVFLYITASIYPFIKQHLRHMIYGLLLIIVLGNGLWVKSSSMSILAGVAAAMTASWTRWIPFWGWIKGFMMSAVEGNIALMFVFLFLVVASVLGLIYVTWKQKVDFYEDAMEKAEEKAALLRKAQEDKGSGIVVSGKKKKDRSDKLLRDGNMHGQGASVFFFKAMYNRFRFAHLHIFTKTTETYLVTAIGGILLFKLLIEADGLIPILCAFCAIAFFRALGNPLVEDTKMDFFVMIPENTWMKLFYSLLGGCANCFLDMLPGAILVMIVFPTNALMGFLFLLFAVTVDVYCTCVGSFIDLAVPVNAGKMVKQLIQVMFVYFGLLPDILIIAIAFVTNHLTMGICMAMIVNLFLGGMFFAFTPFLLDSGNR